MMRKPLTLSATQTRMLHAHVPLVRRILGMRRVPEVYYDDAMQAGMIGLAQAIRRYDPNHPSGAKLSTYAVRWIRVSIERELARHRRALTHVGLLTLGFALIDEDDTEAAALEREIQRDAEEVVENDIVRRIDTRRLLGFVADLPAIEAEVVLARISGDTQTMVGDRMSLTHQRISQIEQSAVRVLQRRCSTLARPPRMSA